MGKAGQQLSSPCTLCLHLQEVEKARSELAEKQARHQQQVEEMSEAHEEYQARLAGLDETISELQKQNELLKVDNKVLCHSCS